METLALDGWHIWAIVALAFVILEIFTSGFAVMCFSFGAIAAAIASAFGLSLLWQLGLFAVFSGLAFVFVRPAVLKLLYKRNQEAEVKTNGDAFIGRVVRVSEVIDADANTGCVSVDGGEWKAVSADGSVIAVGTMVEIIARESIVLTVRNSSKN